MTTEEKLEMVKTILRTEGDAEDALLSTYLDMAKRELLGWRYSLAIEAPDEVPEEYEMTQVMAVVTGYTQAGIEGQNISIENSVHRHFKYIDMVNYIRGSVLPMAGGPQERRAEAVSGP